MHAIAMFFMKVLPGPDTNIWDTRQTCGDLVVRRFQLLLTGGKASASGRKVTRQRSALLVAALPY